MVYGKTQGVPQAYIMVEVFSYGRVIATMDIEEINANSSWSLLLRTLSAGSADAAIQLLVVDKLDDLMRIQVDAIKNLKIDSVTVWDING